MAKLSVGIVGLPNVGKSTLFNALTAHGAAASNYPFCTIDPNVGVVEVPDDRLQVLSDISGSKKLIPAVIEFVDIAGLVKGASKGEGLGNKFLSNIRETDAIAHVVRCFDSDDVVHVEGKVDPIGDIETIELELMLADLQMAEASKNRVERQAKSGDKEAKLKVEVLGKAIAHLNENQPLRSLNLSEDEQAALVSYPFLTAKRVIYVANVSEDDLPELENDYVRQVRKRAAEEGNSVVTICSKIEEEVAQLPKNEQLDFLQELGLKEPGLHRLIRESYAMLGLITFLTTGEQETRAWTVRKGAAAPEAAGRIHTDIQRGFIRAEVISFDDMVEYGGRVKAKEAGRMRAEGKEYIVKDGDVMLFLHS
jgi:ribosome-binding ATPase